jgi:hypothetical protein
MNNYILAIAIVAFGILCHYAFFVTQREGLTTAAEEEAAKQARQNQETINIWQNHAQSLLNTAQQQQQMITTLENNNTILQHILACLKYRKDLMNLPVIENRKARKSQGADKKAKLKGVFKSTGKLS